MPSRLAFALLLPLLLSLPLAAQQDLAADAELVETRHEVPKLAEAKAYVPKDGVVEIELSEYAGYAGLIVANGGLAPNENSPFTKKHGFKLKLTISEEESWSALNSGKMAASATTVDVLAVYGRQFKVTVPALIGFSRGADGIVVRKGIKRVNDLKGKVLATCQFTEADFFVRYLAQEAGLEVQMLEDLKQQRNPDKLNLVYCADAFGAGDLFLRDLKAGRTRVDGCVTWAPKTTEVAEESAGKAQVMVTNTNLLIVADILVVNEGFAKANPKMVAALTEGLLEGNRMVRGDLARHLPIIAQAFGWDADEARGEMAKVHLANLAENEAFFAGTIDSAGSYGYIYETAGLVYGSQLLGRVPPRERFLDEAPLKAAAATGNFAGERVLIAPIRTAQTPGEASTDDIAASLLSKEIRFYFEPNDPKLYKAKGDNAKGLDSVAKLAQVSPGSRLLLRGHADGKQVRDLRAAPDFLAKGGETAFRQGRLKLKELATNRCKDVKAVLAAEFKIDASRLSIEGVGMDEPTGKGPDADRRVEVVWFAQ